MIRGIKPGTKVLVHVYKSNSNVAAMNRIHADSAKNKIMKIKKSKSVYMFLLNINRKPYVGTLVLL